MRDFLLQWLRVDQVPDLSKDPRLFPGFQPGNSNFFDEMPVVYRPGEHYRDLEGQFGSPVYERVDAPASPEQKQVLSTLSPDMVEAQELAGTSTRLQSAMAGFRG